MMKPFDSFVFCGRFQGFHNGHKHVVDTGLSLCDRGLILVGSAQEAFTERNPLDVATRIKHIEEIYGNRVMVRPLPDLTNENDITPDWGRYVLAWTKQYFHKVPEIMLYGNDEQRSKWFDPADISWTEVVVNRSNIPISGTRMREFLMLDDIDNWYKWTDQKLHKFYPELRAQLMEVPWYRNKLDKMLREGRKLEGWKDK